LTYLSYLPGGAILSTVGSTAISTFGGITSAKLNNKWENTSSGVNVVYGTVGIVAAAGEDITKMSKMTFKTAGGTNVKLVLKDVVKNASKSGAGKIYLVAGVTLALEDVKNLGEALQEMKNGKQQNELKLACNAAYAG
jgi:predicted membrane-bound mannosyltransferase